MGPVQILSDRFRFYQIGLDRFRFYQIGLDWNIKRLCGLYEKECV